MSIAMVCASHSPMLLDEPLGGADACEAVIASFRDMADFVDDFDPDVIIQFSPDHFHGFHYNMMPSFCVGTAARSYGDYTTQAGDLVVDETLALELLDAVRHAEIDLAVSFDMIVDHGFVQIWETMWGDFTRYPIIPIFINCVADPIPTYNRVIKLGEAVGAFAAKSGKRVLVAASGGLSHDPIMPKIVGAEPDLRARLVGSKPLTLEQQAEREKNIRRASEQLKDGEGPCLPLNPDWDRKVMAMLANADWDGFKNFKTEEIDQIAGKGANETMCWVAATAALSMSGAYDVVQSDYREIPGWIAGFGHFTAQTTSAI
ncbi:MAG: 3-carboxyethylcatechol 2,3-dioxygenase [Pseudomonadota bacterium]